MPPKPAAVRAHPLTKRVESLETETQVLKTQMHGVQGELRLIRSENEKQTGHLGTLVQAFGRSPDLATGDEGAGLCGTLAAIEQDRRDRVKAEAARAELEAEQQAEDDERRAKRERVRAWIAWGFGLLGTAAAILGGLHLLHAF